MANKKRRKRVYYADNEKFNLARYISSISGPVVFFVIIVAVIFVMSIFFRVSNITVVGNTHYTDEEIIRAIDIEEGDNLFFFDRFAALSRVFAKLPYIEEVSVERRLPDKVIITVTESQALAYIVLGDEYWTIDHGCKILGKATEEELSGLIPIDGIRPGTLMIGEDLQTEDNDTQIVDYISEVLYQLEARGMYRYVGRVNFANKNHVYFSYDDKYTVQLGDAAKTEYKFGMFASALSQLLDGDVGTIDVSDANIVRFTPN